MNNHGMARGEGREGGSEEGRMNGLYVRQGSQH